MRRVHVERQLSGRVDEVVLKWFKHVDRIDEECGDMMIFDVEGNWCRGRPRLGCMDGVKRALGKGVCLSVGQGRQNALDRRRWELTGRSK